MYIYKGDYKASNHLYCRKNWLRLTLNVIPKVLGSNLDLEPTILTVVLLLYSSGSQDDVQC